MELLLSVDSREPAFFSKKSERLKEKRIPFKLLPEVEPDFAIPVFISMKKIAC